MIGRIANRVRRWRVTTLKKFGAKTDSALRLTIGDRDPDVARALADAFCGVECVEVVQGSLLDVSADAIVCPGNSFGDMGGGFDKAVDDFHRGQAQEAVAAAIAREFYGELPVGSALLARPPTTRTQFLIVAPTMRVPGNVADSINSYLATRAALVAVLRHNAKAERPIGTIAMPGMCTGIGGMNYQEAATQMRVAFDSVMGGRWRQVGHPAMAPYALRSRNGHRK